MKKFLNFSIAAFVAVLVFSACSDDDPATGPCYNCELSFFGITTENDFCDDGTNMTDVTITALGISVDTTVNQSAADYATTLETAGYTCTMN